MPFALIFGAIGLIAQVAGAATTAAGTRQAAEASARNETLRERQMLLESQRQRREIFRQAVRARAASLTASTAQGGTGGSGAAGGQAQIAAQSTSNVQGVNQAQSISSGIFQGNREIARAQALAAFGQGLTSLGQNISGLRFE